MEKSTAESFGIRVQELRKAAGMSQEDLAERAGLHRTHISLIERGRRVVRLDTIHQLAEALGAHPALLLLTRPLPSETPGFADDRKSMELWFPFIVEYQKLGRRHGVRDVFQDNGGKLLQSLLILELTNTGKREGNDARDKRGREYELKSVNRNLTSSFSTHHHLNPEILGKYRKVQGWYFSVYEDIELVAIYAMSPDQLEPYFSKWETKWNENGRDINNPKIPVRFVESNGRCVYERKPLPT